MDISVTISDTDVKALENDLLSVNDWVQDAVKGKISNATKRFLAEWEPKLRADPDVSSIPASTTDFIALVVARSDYKNRAEREEAS